MNDQPNTTSNNQAPQTWQQQTGPDDSEQLVRDVTCANFMQAVEIINQVAELAEAADHHPDLHLTGYKNLRIELSSHDAGNTVTDRDHRLATQIEEVIEGAEN